IGKGRADHDALEGDVGQRFLAHLGDRQKAADDQRGHEQVGNPWVVDEPLYYATHQCFSASTAVTVWAALSVVSGAGTARAGVPSINWLWPGRSTCSPAVKPSEIETTLLSR